jgi:hypothetical protein
MIAQTCLETGYGQHVISSSYNLFNIKGSGPAGSVSVKTKEFENGKYITITANFRKYHNYAESFADYAALITGNKRYAPAIKVKSDPKKYVQELQKCGYATDPKYGTNIISIMDSFKIIDLVTKALKPAPAPTPKPQPKADARVKTLQHQLNIYMGSKLVEDGIKGAKTVAAINSVCKTTLKLNSKGATVKLLQARLGGLTIDGIFGANTLAAVKKFQTSKKLTVDGVVGVKTWNELLK